MDAFVRWKCENCKEAGNPNSADRCKGCGEARKKKAKSLACALGMRQNKDGTPFTKRYKSANLRDPWRAAYNGSVLFRSFQPSTPPTSSASLDASKIAAFDFDGCLCNFQRGMIVGNMEQRVIHKSTREILSGLFRKGYRLVIFSNESLGRFKNAGPIQDAVDRKTKRVDEFLRYINLPFEVYMATEKDKFRKPSTVDRARNGTSCGGIGMWEFMSRDPNEIGFKVQPQLSDSFYVGDAAGRGGDISDGDKLFAAQVGVEFFTPEQFFLSDGTGPGLAGLSSASSLKDFEAQFPPDTVRSHVRSRLTPSSFQNSQPLVMVFVGFPGSGKSTAGGAVEKLLGDSVVTRISQDVLKTRAKVEAAAHQALVEKKTSVVMIDRTNLSIDQREQWIELGHKNGAHVMVVHFDLEAGACVSRLQLRTDHEGKNFPTERGAIIGIMSRLSGSFVAPDASTENFDSLLEIDAALPAFMTESYLSLAILKHLAPDALESDQVLKSWSSALAALSSRFTLPPEERVVPFCAGNRSWSGPSSVGDKYLAFSSLSTGDFQFDPKRACSVLIKVASRWLKEKAEYGVKLVLCEPASSTIVQVLNENQTLRDRVDRMEHFEIVNGTAVEHHGAFCVGVGIASSLTRPGENKANVLLHKKYRGLQDQGMSVEALIRNQLGDNLAPTVGSAFSVKLPLSHPQRKEFDTEYLVFVLGPNMNPERKGCLNGDYTKGEELLERAYVALFEAYLRHALLLEPQSSSATSSSTSSSSSTALIQFSEYKAPEGPPPKFPGNWKDALHHYCSLEDSSSRAAKQVFYRDEKYCIIYDAFAKARVHLLVLMLSGSGMERLNEMKDLDVSHINALRSLEGFLETKLLPHLGRYCAAPIRVGFHAVPSMNRLHVHVISQDFDSMALKNKKHWISFTHEDYFIPLKRVIQILETRPSELADLNAKAKTLEAELACHRCGAVQNSIPVLKSHVQMCKSPWKT